MKLGGVFMFKVNKDTGWDRVMVFVNQPKSFKSFKWRQWHDVLLYLNRPSDVRLGEAEPDQTSNGHTNTQPGEEAEQIDDREDVLGDGVHHGQQALRETNTRL